ncbi:integral membrane protein DUF92-domain-containing protein [Hyaloraphidium curvatum]|nr:integral membrane protein DUF92-domain-containing protein [Hyaloraphidium curvatum]
MTCSPALGSVLLAFCFTGTAATRYHEADKERWDLEAHKSRRGAMQVLCTAGVGAACAAYLFAKLDREDAGIGFATTGVDDRDAAVLAYLGSFACVCGDTWASELGILSSDSPRLVTTMGKVPRGTNGGVSSWGLLCSAGGGAFVGVFALGIGTTGRALGFVGGRPIPSIVVPLMAGAGLFGSLVDSFLGATLQRTWYQPSTGKVTAALPADAVVEDGGFHPEMLAAQTAPGSAGGGPFVVVCGYPLLSNEAVNLVSSAATAAATAFLWRTIHS